MIKMSQLYGKNTSLLITVVFITTLAVTEPHDLEFASLTLPADSGSKSPLETNNWLLIPDWKRKMSGESEKERNQDRKYKGMDAWTN